MIPSPRCLLLVGAGRMGTALHAILRRRRSLPDRYVLRRVGARALLARPTRPRGVGAVVWVLAVRDGDLAATVDALAGVFARGDVVLHLAGMLGPGVLHGARAHGAAVGSLHPLVAVARGNTGDVAEGGAFLFEGDARAKQAARVLVRALGGTLLVADAVDRARYHGGAALVATGAVAIAQGATTLFESALTPPPSEEQLRAAVASLLRSVASNVEAVGARQALASPLLRDDTATVARHLAAMGPWPTTRGLYRAAVGQVLDALEADGTVKPSTITEARRLVADGGSSGANLPEARSTLDPAGSDRVK